MYASLIEILYAPFLFFNLVDKLRVEGSSEITSNQEPRLQSTLTTRPVPHYPKLISPFLNCSTLNSPSPHFHFPFTTLKVKLHSARNRAQEKLVSYSFYAHLWTRNTVIFLYLYFNELI